MPTFHLDGFGVDVAISIVAYSICSGTLVLLNKMTLHHLPFPSLVTSFQLSMAVCFIFGAKASGLLPVDPIKMEFIIPYSYYIVGFALGVYCNMKSLSLANVETVIVAKALSPCLVSLLDALMIHGALPPVLLVEKKIAITFRPDVIERPFVVENIFAEMIQVPFQAFTSATRMVFRASLGF